MKFADLEYEYILDEDNKTDIIHIDNVKTSKGFFYRKSRYLSKDFKGNIINNPHDYIKTSSLWFADLKANNKVELLPFGNYDINGMLSLMGNYLYYIKTIDKDNDGFLENDYKGGDVFRINIHNLRHEFCCEIDPYNFYGFEAADEQFFIFHSENQIHDTAEEVFIDLINKRKAVLKSNSENGTGYIRYEYIPNEFNSIAFVIINETTNDDTSVSEENRLICFRWENFVNMLEWQDIKNNSI